MPMFLIFLAALLMVAASAAQDAGRVSDDDGYGVRRSSAAEDALRQQLSFWRFLGVCAVLVLALYAVIIALAGLAAVFASGSYTTP